MHLIADHAVVLFGAAVLLHEHLLLALLGPGQALIALLHALDLFIQRDERHLALPLLVVDLIGALLAAANEGVLLVNLARTLVVVNDIGVLLDVEALVLGELAPLIEQ